MNAQRHCTVCGGWTAPNNIDAKCLAWVTAIVKAYKLLAQSRRVVAFMRFKAERATKTPLPGLSIRRLTAEEMDAATVIVPSEVSGAEYARMPIRDHATAIRFTFPRVRPEDGLEVDVALYESARSAFVDELTATVERRLEEIAK